MVDLYSAQIKGYEEVYGKEKADWWMRKMTTEWYGGGISPFERL